MAALGTTSIQSNFRIPILSRRHGLSIVVCHAYVDENDWNRCMQKAPWRLHINGYAVSNADGKSLLMHRFITDCKDPNVHIHHIDGCKLNNTKANLALMTKAQHHHTENVGICTQTGRQTKYYGVTYNKASRKWRAFVYNRNKQFFIGAFTTAEDAALAYNNFITLHNLQRRLNVLT